MSVGGHQAVFFDAGGTLTFADPSGDEIWVAALEEHGYHVTKERLFHTTGVPGPEFNRSDIVRALRGAAEGLTRDLPSTLEEERAYFRRYDAMVLERLGIPAAEEIMESVDRRFQEGLFVRLYEDTEPALQILQDAGCRLGVISNAPHDLPDRLEELGLARYFDAITYSFEVGVEKPHPRIFRTALERLDVPPSRAIHVGDTYGPDILGARGAGMTPILISRSEELPSVDCIAIRSLRDVVSHL